jgi:hypothetical protein
MKGDIWFDWILLTDDSGFKIQDSKFKIFVPRLDRQAIQTISYLPLCRQEFFQFLPFDSFLDSRSHQSQHTVYSVV